MSTPTPNAAPANPGSPYGTLPPASPLPQRKPVSLPRLAQLRAEGEKDPRGVANAREMLAMAYGLIDGHMAGRSWAAGEAFSLADCAAAPALFYAGIVAPWGEEQGALGAYFERLVARPSVARTLAEARPFFEYFPYRELMPARFLEGA